jgi:hypothetical protein
MEEECYRCQTIFITELTEKMQSNYWRKRKLRQ